MSISSNDSVDERYRRRSTRSDRPRLRTQRIEMLPLIGSAEAIALQQVMESFVLRVPRAFGRSHGTSTRPAWRTMEPPTAHEVLIDGNCTSADEPQPSLQWNPDPTEVRDEFHPRLGPLQGDRYAFFIPWLNAS